MDLSLFLAKFLGLYFIILGTAYLFKRELLRGAIYDFYRSPALLVVTSFIQIMVGLLIVLNHPQWEWSWKGLITLLGYLVLFKGIVNLFVPEWGRNLSYSFSDKNIMTYSGILTLALGLYLFYYGFVA